MKTIRLVSLSCKRCGHTWTPRGTTITICPGCKSAHWQTARKTRQGLRPDAPANARTKGGAR